MGYISLTGYSRPYVVWWELEWAMYLCFFKLTLGMDCRFQGRLESLFYDIRHPCKPSDAV